jgi:hypothetical protein
MGQNMIKLPLKDRSFAHCIYSNNPVPPKTFSKYIEWIREGENTIDTYYTDYCIKECEGGYGWLLEPRELIPEVYEYVEKNSRKFKKIFTHDLDLIKKIDATFVPFGGCWIDEKDYGIHSKSKNFSIIASGKQQLEGHRLRHNIIKASGNRIDVFGNGYKPIKDKIEGLKEYRYHFAIENCKKDYWFTEKLIDCLMTGTIPIYWGCPSIFKFFNSEGVIIFDSLHDLKEKLKLCNPEYYESKLPAIRENLELARKYLLAEDWLYENVINSPQSTT